MSSDDLIVPSGRSNQEDAISSSPVCSSNSFAIFSSSEVDEIFSRILLAMAYHTSTSPPMPVINSTRIVSLIDESVDESFG